MTTVKEAFQAGFQKEAQEDGMSYAQGVGLAGGAAGAGLGATEGYRLGRSYGHLTPETAKGINELATAGSGMLNPFQKARMTVDTKAGRALSHLGPKTAPIAGLLGGAALGGAALGAPSYGLGAAADGLRGEQNG